MGIINVLDFQVANLIAAGEVVDRPASVVKELLENAIDAGADTVTVEIKRGGVSFIRITDNGCGMAKEDVPVSLKRHATSKIRSASDLDSILTLGFRGEALAAISSVSEMRIMTKRREDPVGTVLSASGGRITSIADSGCPDGTTVIVENLFFNTPARLKFLKKDGTEATGVSSYVEKIALSHPEITVRFISDGVLKYSTTGDGDRKACIYAVLGRDFAKKSMEVRGGFDGVDVTGYIGTPENIRGNRNLQVFFINNRYIRSKTVCAALEQAFSTYIPGDKFPCAVLYLEMNPALVDVNVHPAKLEVKFSNERLIFESVYYAVRGALEQKLDRPELKLLEKRSKALEASAAATGFAPMKEGRGGEKTESVQNMRQTLGDGVSVLNAAPEKKQPQTVGRAPEKPEELPPLPADAPPVPDDAVPDLPVTVPELNPVTESGTFRETAVSGKPAGQTDGEKRKPETEESMFSYMKLPPLPGRPKKDALTEDGKDAAPSPAEKPRTADAEVPGNGTQKADVPAYRMVGEVFQCYVILEAGDTMYLVDKHAAHERILFEEFKACAKNSETCSQLLLMPLEITLTAEEAEAAEQFREEISDAGFGFDLDGRTASLSLVPAFLDTAQAKDAFCEACANLADNTGTAALTRELRFERALFQASCKAAVKAGRNYDAAHLKWICDRVLSDPAIRYCPHGRPVCFEMTKAMVENRFGRT